MILALHWNMSGSQRKTLRTLESNNTATVAAVHHGVESLGSEREGSRSQGVFVQRSMRRQIEIIV
jgi:hypothetical protein